MKNIKLNYLKVKIQNLADEAKYIRKNEVKAAHTLEALKLRNKLAHKDELSQGNMNRIVKNVLHTVTEDNLGMQITYPLKHLEGIFGKEDVEISGNSVYITKEFSEQDPSWLEYQHRLKVELKEHRKTVVRDEARAAQLAYAFLRGKKYRDLEGNSNRTMVPTYSVSGKPTNKAAKIWGRVRDIAYGFGQYGKTYGEWQLFKGEFEAWQREAVTYLLYNR